jgi:hypothetical protein
MKARVSFVLVALALLVGSTSLPGCDVLAKFLAPTPTPTPQKQATLPGGNVGYRLQAAVPGRSGEQ